MLMFSLIVLTTPNPTMSLKTIVIIMIALLIHQPPIFSKANVSIIQSLPPSLVVLNEGQTFNITCGIAGDPTPEVIWWRLNWGRVPEKCIATSANGLGILTCPDMQISDQGTYICEGVNAKGSIITTPGTVLTILDNGLSSGKSSFINGFSRLQIAVLSGVCFSIWNLVLSH